MLFGVSLVLPIICNLASYYFIEGENGKEVPVEETKDNKMVIPFNRTSFVIIFFSFSKQFHCNK